ncbi:hypothetical protein ACIQ7N_21905 [Lysinibacillus sp. NPDC095746]
MSNPNVIKIGQVIKLG